MTMVRLKYLHRIRTKGQDYWYFRHRGTQKAIPGQPGEAAFMRAYNVLLAGAQAEAPSGPRRAPIAAGSIAQAVTAYFASADFNKLGPVTRQVRRRILEAVVAKSGAAMLADITDQDVRSAAEARKPNAAVALLKALRGLFKWAIVAKLVSADPTREVARPVIKTDGHHSWTPEEVRQFEARHEEGGKARLALALLLWTGARRGDVVALGPLNRRPDGTIRWRTGKTGTWVTIPILPDLARALDPLPRSAPAFLMTEYGRPFTGPGFGNWFRDRCNEAGLPHCSAHGLRKAAASMLAESGASELELMAVFGWLDSSTAAIYTRAARRDRMAREGMNRLARNGQ